MRRGPSAHVVSLERLPQVTCRTRSQRNTGDRRKRRRWGNRSIRGGWARKRIENVIPSCRVGDQVASDTRSGKAQRKQRVPGWRRGTGEKSIDRGPRYERAAEESRLRQLLSRPRRL